MRTGWLFTAIGVLLLVLLLSKGSMQFTASTLDIHILDTYFIIAYWHFILFLILVLGTFFSIGAVVGTRLRNKYFLWMLLVFVAADAFVVYGMKELFL